MTHLLRLGRAHAALALLASAVVFSAGCAAPLEDSGDAPDENVGSTSSALTTSPERAVLAKLGRPARFLVGLGNDVTAAEGYDPNRAHAFTLGAPLDIHYLYLSGLPGEGGWTDWNAPAGQYVTMHAEAAKARGVIPMFTLYQAAAWGEGNLTAFDNATFMTKYWRGVRTMYQRLNALGVPAIVHLEPDLWGYFQQRGEDPAAVRVKVGSHVPECTDLPGNAAGFGKCMVRLARRLAPKVVVGLSASSFGAYTNGQPDPLRVAAYLNKVGAAESDIMIVEQLDRDAGCFEAATDPNCKRTGAFYWDETNQRTPTFHQHLAWSSAIRKGTGKPLLWWQTPLGVPSSTAGGWSGKYRDNRVRYMFAHPGEYVAAGGIGAVFGTGAPNQTTAKTDGGQFKNAVTRYASAPAWMP